MPNDALPTGLFAEPPALRILRIDDQWRYLTLMAKEHGTSPDSRTGQAMEAFAVNYVLRGAGVYREDGGREHVLAPGTLFQRLPGRRHSTLLDPASDYAELFLVLDRATAVQLLDLRLILDAEVLTVGAGGEVVEAFRALRREMLRPEAELATRDALALVIGFLGRLYALARRAGTGEAGGDLIGRACALLERGLDERLNMPHLAARLGVPYPTFRRRFRAAMQVSPGAYRVRRRLEQACFLLLERPVKEVADALGYSDPFTFSAQFKAHLGVSPQHFQAREAAGGKPRAVGEGERTR